MEFYVVKESLLVLINFIKQHKETIKYKNFIINYTIHAIQTYHHYHQELCNFFPIVLNNIIIEYTNNIFDIDVTISIDKILLPTNSNIYYQILIKNDILRINHKYFVTMSNSKIIIRTLIIHAIRQNILEYANHLSFASYYTRKYQSRTLQILYDNSINYEYDSIISQIMDKEQLNNEMIVIVAIFNSLHNLDL